MTAHILKSRLVRLGVSTVGTLAASAAVSVAPVGAAQVTLGSTGGTPSANICAAAASCTYVPLTGSREDLLVPVSGTVTSFSVRSASVGNTVVLRRLVEYRGLFGGDLATSPPEVLTVASPRDNTYAVSLPVGAGDVIGLDNSDGALMFDRSSSGSITDYFQPALASNSVPDRLGVATNGYRLLLSATITASPPSLKKVSQSRRRWRAGNKLPVLDPAVFAKQPVGTVIRFTLGEPATVRFSFAQLLSGRRVNGKCVAPTAANRRRRSCTRSVPRGSLAYDKTSVRGYGPTRFCNCGEMLVFQGRLTPTRNLRPGTYTVTITATNIAGQRASKALRPFTIIGG